MLIKKLLAVLSIQLTLVASTAQAATWHVTNNSDADPSPPAGSLRSVLGLISNGDTIVFDGNYTIKLVSPINPSKVFTMTGSGRTVTIKPDSTVFPGGQDGMFRISFNAGWTYFDNITMTGMSGVRAVYVASTGKFQMQDMEISNFSNSPQVGTWQGGAGVQCAGECNLRESYLHDLTFGVGGTTYGGAILIEDSTVGSAWSSYIQDNRIMSNTANRGGAIALMDNAKVRVRRNTIDKNNSTSEGGGVHFDGYQVNFETNTVTDNAISSVGTGGGFAGINGRVYLWQNHFINNSAGSNSAHEIYLSNTLTSIDMRNNLVGMSGAAVGTACYVTIFVVPNASSLGNVVQDTSCRLPAAGNNTAPASLGVGTLGFEAANYTIRNQAGVWMWDLLNTSPGVNYGVSVGTTSSDQRLYNPSGAIDTGAYQYGGTP